MNKTNSPTIEQVLFERMGVTIDDALATGADFVDETVSSAIDAGIDVDARLNGLGKLLEKISEPSIVSALGDVLDNLPQLVQLAKLANKIPDMVAAIGDTLDCQQQHCTARGIDVEKAITNGLHAALFLGTQVDREHLQRIGDLLGSDILNRHAVNVVNNVAQSLTNAQQNVCEANSKRVGLFGLIRALRNPEMQRSLAFAVQFGKCFGKKC